jgi:hypothetical protein
MEFLLLSMNNGESGSECFVEARHPVEVVVILGKCCSFSLKNHLGPMELRYISSTASCPSQKVSVIASMTVRHSKLPEYSSTKVTINVPAMRSKPLVNASFLGKEIDLLAIVKSINLSICVSGKSRKCLSLVKIRIRIR